MQVSQNGWPTINPRDPQQYKKIQYWTIPGQQRNVIIPMLGAAPGLVLAHWCLRFDRRIEDIEYPIGDDHGHSYRPIEGSSYWSNHASATAVDLNSSQHPQGVRYTFTTDQRNRMLDDIEGKYRNVIRAGFTFRTTVDDMHFELVAGRTAVRELAVALYDTNYGQMLREANPWFTWKP